MLRVSFIFLALAVSSVLATASNSYAVPGHTVMDDLKKIEAAAAMNDIYVQNLEAPSLKQLGAMALTSVSFVAETMSNWIMDKPVNIKAYVITGEFNGVHKTCFATVCNFENGTADVSVVSCGSNFVDLMTETELFPETNVPALIQHSTIEQ